MSKGKPTYVKPQKLTNPLVLPLTIQNVICISSLPRRHQHRHRERGGLQPPPAVDVHARVLLRGRGAGHHCGGHRGFRDRKLHPCGYLPARSLFTYGSDPVLLRFQSACDVLSCGPFAQDYFGVPNVANTTGVPNGAVPTSPIAVLFVQVWQACKHPRARLLSIFSLYIGLIP